MKKLTLISLCAALFLFSACRAKKETIVKSDSTAVKNTATQTHLQETHLDTGKKVSSKTTEQKQVIITDNSTHTKTTITPVPGTQSTVDPDGTFHGQAQSVNTLHRGGKKQTQTLDTKLQENAASINRISDTKTTDSLSTVNDSTKVTKLDKHLDIKPSYGTWPWVGGIVILVGLMILLWWFLGRPQGAK
jgi:hypothetical protein